IGIKETGNVMDKETFFEREILQSMLLDHFFSPSGPYYESLYEEELIDDSFEYTSNVEQAFSFTLLSTNTKKPEATTERLKQILLQIKDQPITEQTLDVMKKKRIGQVLRA